MKYLILAISILCGCNVLELEKEENVVYTKYCSTNVIIHEALFIDIYDSEGKVYLYSRVKSNNGIDIVFDDIVTTDNHGIKDTLTPIVSHDYIYFKNSTRKFRRVECN